MVKLAPSLPKEYDDNGLESNSRHLLGIYLKQEYTPIVGLIRTKEITQTEDFERVPKVEIVHIELAVDSADAEEVRELIRRLHDDRVGHIKQPLDLPDTDTPVAVAEPLELEAGEVQYKVALVDEANAKIALFLLAPSGALVAERHAIPRTDLGDGEATEPGDYQVGTLNGELRALADALIRDYEAGFTVATAPTEDNDVVDAEVIDDDTTEEV